MQPHASVVAVVVLVRLGPIELELHVEEGTAAWMFGPFAWRAEVGRA